MAFKNMLLSLALVIAAFSACAAATRDFFPANANQGFDLAARLEASGGLVECWNALTELKSCTNEIVQFFLNGQANLGPGCCRAIDIITRNCWPAMLTSLGLTAEEGNILRGYCDVAASAPAPSPVGSMALA